jgi:hypothetical protein
MWFDSWFSAFSVVSGVGGPPVAGTRKSGPSSFGENTMTPSRFQVPPPGGPGNASPIDCVVPVLISYRLSFPPAKNPNEALSGDQKGS